MTQVIEIIAGPDKQMNLKDIKEMTNKELLDADRFYRNGNFRDHDIERELLSRLEAGENLKCCGNCKSNDCPERYADSNENHYCDKWRSDGMIREERRHLRIFLYQLYRFLKTSQFVHSRRCK